MTTRKTKISHTLKRHGTKLLNALRVKRDRPVRQEVDAPHPCDPGRVLRVMTYNIHHARGTDRRYDLERIARVIRESGADVVALQEIERFRGRTRCDDQPAQLAKLLGMHYAFAAVCDYSHVENHHKAGYGIAILSRFPIAAREHFNISFGNVREARGCLHVRLDVDGFPLHVFNVHLGLRYRERHYQMDRLLSEEIVNHSRYNGSAKILLGDFNNWWPVKSARTVNMHFHDASAVTGRKKLRTFGRYFTYLCLDYIFTSRDVTIVSCDVLRRGPAAVASDHRPVVCSIRLPVCAPHAAGLPAETGAVPVSA